MIDLNIKDVDELKKNKAVFVLKCKGKNLSIAVKEMIDKLAKEYDEKKF